MRMFHWLKSKKNLTLVIGFFLIFNNITTLPIYSLQDDLKLDSTFKLKLEIIEISPSQIDLNITAPLSIFVSIGDINITFLDNLENVSFIKTSKNLIGLRPNESKIIEFLTNESNLMLSEGNFIVSIFFQSINPPYAWTSRNTSLTFENTTSTVPIPLFAFYFNAPVRISTTTTLNFGVLGSIITSIIIFWIKKKRT